jgi:predicted phage tail protein
MAEAATLREIHLHGVLGQKYGPMHKLAVSCPAEAFRALFANFPKMRADIRAGKWLVIRGDLTKGLSLNEHNLGIGLGNKAMHIVPEGMGAKSGGGQAKLVLGAVLIIASVATMQFEGVGLAAGVLGAGTVSFGQIAGIGAALAISGISQMIAPTSKPAATASSNLISGATNTAQEGTALPILYGELRTGSVQGSVFLGTTQLTGPYVPPGINDTSYTNTQFPGVQVLIQT